MSQFTLASFFAGVGGIDLGFEQTGKVSTIYANEFDTHAGTTFSSNFSCQLDPRSISDVHAEDVPNVDIISGGFPCQAFSIEGARQGFADTKGRGELFFELLRIIEAKSPSAIFLENVKNLVGHDKGNTFRVIMESLESIGYHCTYRVLNACEYGNVPQNRERIYIVGFKSHDILGRFSFPEPVPLTTKVRDIVDYTTELEDASLYTISPRVREQLNQAMDDTSAVYQRRRDHVRKNKSGVIPTLTASMGTGGGNIPFVITEHGARKLTIRECFRAQGFPDEFAVPSGAPKSQLYKQAGNSVCVPVIRRIASNMVSALPNTTG